MTLKEQKIGFLGAGKMASAIIKGLLKYGVSPENIAAGERWAPAADAARKEFGIYVTEDNADVVRRSDILIIAVKPKDIEEALSTAGDTKDKLFISIAAGVTIDSLEQMVGSGARVIRVMPNICATVLQSATGISRGTQERYFNGACHWGFYKDGNYPMYAMDSTSDGSNGRGISTP